MRRISVVLATAVAMASTCAVAEDAYPSKPIHIVVAQAPGGASDILARMLGQEFSAQWKQPIIVDNRAGASGAIAAEYCAKSAPDGYTLFIGSAGIMAIAPAIDASLRYAPQDFVPIAHIASLSNVFVVKATSGYKSIADLAAAAKAQAGGLSFATNGTGSTNEIASIMFLRSASVKGVEVPYKGDAPAMSDLLGGHIDFYAASMPIALPQITTGEVVPLAVTSASRSPHLPSVPTVAESGLKGYEISQWYAMYVPVGTPSNIATKLSDAMKSILTQPGVQNQILASGMEISTEAQKDFPAFDRAEREKWGAFVKSTLKSAGKP